MNCPRCDSNLKVEKYKGIEVDRCVSCEGMWLEHHELDELEDKAMDDDDSKGTMITRSGPSELKCPNCQGGMLQFRYRYNELWLDVCELEHGFWLDKGEEKRVLELMEQRIKDLKRSGNAEQEWAKLLERVGGKSFFQGIKDKLRR